MTMKTTEEIEEEEGGFAALLFLLTPKVAVMSTKGACARMETSAIKSKEDFYIIICD